MTEMMDYLKEAMEQNANELFLAPQVPPRYRQGRQWKNIGFESLKPGEAKDSLLKILSSDDQAEFLSKGASKGQLHAHGRMINYSLSLSAQGICGHFQWIESENLEFQNWGFPIYVSEIIGRGCGLSLITGSRRSGKTSALGAIVKDQARKKRSVISIFADAEELNIPSQESVICNFSSSHLINSTAQAEASDLVVIDSQNNQILKIAVELAERGVNLLCAMSAQNIQAALERISEVIEENPEIGMKRISHCLQMAIGLRLMPGIEATLVPAFEMLMGTSSVRNQLHESNWGEVELTMATSGEKTGMRSMNQALLQLILKRKIELKVGFEESPRPDELDQMLKKVGF